LSGLGCGGGPTTGRREPEWELLERWRECRPPARDDRAVSDGVSKLTRSVGDGVSAYILAVPYAGVRGRRGRRRGE